jgi:hypothetical protein
MMAATANAIFAATTALIPGSTCHFIEVTDRYYPDYVGFTRWYYRRRRRFPLVQIVWPNNDGHYPGRGRSAILQRMATRVGDSPDRMTGSRFELTSKRG